LSRILLAWELGNNLGHLSRLLPLGRRLRGHGHSLLAVVRDLALAARVLGPAGIPFIQAPRMSMASKVSTQPASYADVLRHTGWADTHQLWGMTQAWINVLRMFSPDLVVLDHSPTALLAARCTTTPCVAPHVEAQLTAHRVECIGAGLTLRGNPDERRVTATLNRLLNVAHFKTRAAAFAAHHRGFDSGHAAENIVDEIESLVARRQPGSSRANSGGLVDC
jgi:UDP:flavonoid glycosyltransferase YjiC (YdhE family)